LTYKFIKIFDRQNILAKELETSLAYLRGWRRGRLMGESISRRPPLRSEGAHVIGPSGYEGQGRAGRRQGLRVDAPREYLKDFGELIDDDVIGKLEGDHLVRGEGGSVGGGVHAEDAEEDVDKLDFLVDVLYEL